MMATLSVLVVVLLFALVLASASVRMVQQYERGVVLRFGRLRPRLRSPGLQLIIPIADRLTKVSMQTVVMGIPAQGAITRDNVTLTVDAVVYFRVIDPVKAIINVQNYPMAVSQVAQTSLRAVIGRSDLDTLLSDRESINAELKAVIDAPTEEPWGLHIERVEVKDVSLPEGMKRSMSRQAEAERERRARVIAADGEYQASTKLAQAARAMADTPGALQLRLLQTVVDVAAEKNSTLVMPFPVELLRFFDHAAHTDIAGLASALATPQPLAAPDDAPHHAANGGTPSRTPDNGTPSRTSDSGTPSPTSDSGTPGRPSGGGPLGSAPAGPREQPAGAVRTRPEPPRGPGDTSAQKHLRRQRWDV